MTVTRQGQDKVKTKTKWAQDTAFRGIKKFSGGGVDSENSFCPRLFLQFLQFLQLLQLLQLLQFLQFLQFM